MKKILRISTDLIPINFKGAVPVEGKDKIIEVYPKPFEEIIYELTDHQTIEERAILGVMISISEKLILNVVSRFRVGLIFYCHFTVEPLG